jgi:putative DNA primase/helicase
LENLDIWCLYRIEWRAGEAKPAKVPYQTNGKRARPNDPATFSSYFDVLVAYERGGYDGIGFLIPGDIVVVDLDDCCEGSRVLERRFSELEIKVTQHFASYTELSPSKKGVHIILKAPGFVMDKERYYTNNRAMGLEVYVGGQTNRFMTFTGRRLGQWDYSDQDKTPALVDFMEAFMRRRDSPAADTPARSGMSHLTDEEVIAKASTAKGGERFVSLWFGYVGDNGDRSAADMALCNRLCYWCNCDAAQMDRIFRASNLMRPKWDERRGEFTYGELTISRAITSCKAWYEPYETKGAKEQ